MGKFAIYNIPLKSLVAGAHQYEFQLDDQFFKNIDEGDIKHGSVKVNLSVKRSDDIFELDFDLEGEIKVSCDRCLDHMTLPVSVHEKLYVKFGREYSEESDNIVIIPESDGDINVAWFLYEFIALTIPLKHTHAPGMCNKAVISKLRKHTARSTDDDDDSSSESDDELFGGDDESVVDNEPEQTDPRWDGLKQIIDNN